MIKEDYMNNKRSRLVFSVLLVAGVLKSTVIALGLGELELKSALNQPLDATIKIAHTNGLTEEEILVSLGSKNDFEAAGVDRFFFLTELKFGVYIESDSSGVIHITTRNPVDEPYLDFIVETQWPTGRLLREYTVLLDPPVFQDNKTQTFVTPVSEPTANATVTTTEQKQPVTAVTTPPRTSESATRTAARQGGHLQTTDETLWEIALKARPNSEYSIQQTMLALQDQNPRAFMRGNINLIKQHQNLKVPTPDQIRARSFAQAERDVAYQNKMFSEGRRLPRKPAPMPMVAAKPSIETQTGASSKGNVAELKLVSAEGTAGDAAGGMAGGTSNTTPEGLQSALALSEENLDKSEQEKLDLSTRMVALEKNLETMQKLLTLKDEQMALLQAEIDGSEVSAVPPAVEPVVTALEPEEVAPAAVTPEPVVTEPAAEPAMDETQDVTPAPVSEKVSGSLVSQLLDNVYLLGAAVALVLLALFFVLRRGKDTDEEGFQFDETEGEFGPLTDSDFNQDGLEDISGFDDAEELQEDSVSEEVSEDLTVETPAEVKAETSDVIAEADIYLAYGRSQPAIDILGSAILDEPSRSDIRLKLLEVYADQNDSAAFDRALSQLTELGDDSANQQAAELRTRMVVDDEPEGEEVNDLVFDLYETDELESASVDEPEEIATETTNATADLLATQPEVLDDLSFDLEDESTEGNIDLPDFSIDEIDSDPVVSSLEKSIAEHQSRDEQDIGEIDFDVDMKEFDLDASDDLLAEFESAPDADASLDIEEPAELETESGSEVEGGIVFETTDVTESTESNFHEEEDADLDSINMQMRIEAEAIVAKIQEQDVVVSAPSSDDDDLDLDSLHMKLQENLSAEVDLGDATESDEQPEPTSSSEDEVVGDPNLDGYMDSILGVDESETKIDLARAYVEMEDFEGARELLKEVLQSGSAEQKQTVEALLADIS